MRLESKMIMKMIPLLILLAGCTIDSGEVTTDFDLAVCTDTRDGETFTIVGSTLRNYRAGIGAPSSYQIDDTEGRTRTLSSDMSAWLKCVPQ